MSQEIITKVARAFHDHSKELYLVGGTVRDALLGRSSHDIDMATNALPTQIKEIVAITNPLHVVPIGEKFGTIQVHYTTQNENEPCIIEITTYRGERYHSGSRHPDVQFGTSIVEDLRRRDFTMNALARDARTGTIIDPFGGQADIRKGFIRAVDNADQRFTDDPLRLLRAARFVAQFSFSVPSDTYVAMKRQAHRLAEISQERIRDELSKMLLCPRADTGLWFLHDTTLLNAFLPEVAALSGVMQYPHHRLDVFGHTRMVLSLTPLRLEVRLAALLHDIAKPQTRTIDDKGVTHFYEHEDVGADVARDILRRLRFGNDVVDRVSKIIKLHMRVNAYTQEWSNGAVRRLFVDAEDVLDDLLNLAIADGGSDRNETIEVVRQHTEHLRERIQQVQQQTTTHPLVSPLNGNDLMHLFTRDAGAWLQPVKQHLSDMVIEGTLAPDDKEGAIRKARAFIGD